MGCRDRGNESRTMPVAWEVRSSYPSYITAEIAPSSISRTKPTARVPPASERPAFHYRCRISIAATSVVYWVPPRDRWMHLDATCCAGQSMIQHPFSDWPTVDG